MPSEHWEELIDSWMCHGDQLLNVSVVKGKEGIEDARGLRDHEIRVSDGFIVWPASRIVPGAISAPLEVSFSRMDCAFIVGCGYLSKDGLKEGRRGH